MNPVTTTTGERKSTLRASDNNDNVIMKQVVETHHPDGTDIDVSPLVKMVEEILGRPSDAIDKDSTSTLAHSEMVKLEAKSLQTNIVMMLNVFSHTIRKLAREMSFKNITGGDTHTLALSLFHMVGNYNWDAKLALILAAFAVSYGEFKLPAQIYSSNKLVSPTVHSTPLKQRFDILNRLIHAVLKLTWCIIEYKKLPPKYINSEEQAMSRALIAFPAAVYWNAIAIISFASQITSLTSMGYEHGISSNEIQSWDLYSLIFKIHHLTRFFKGNLEEFRRIIRETEEIDFRDSLYRLFYTVNNDNMKLLKSLLNRRDDPESLFDGATKQRVSVEVLRKRHVLLLISGLQMSSDELSILKKIYSESRIGGSRMETLYDLVWVPIVQPYVEYTKQIHTRFEEMKSDMPWYSVNHPSNIDMAVKKLIGDRWNFKNKPILVALDPQGRELSPNALHMMWIWGSTAFPFNTAREEALWKDETWRLELLVSNMDPTILSWVREDKYIFLYGGDDIEWIRKFTRNARAMEIVARIPLEMAYVGRSKKRENVCHVIATINVEKLSYCWQDIALIWFFWTRLETMLYSKIQLKHADDKDNIMQQIKKLLSYDIDKDGSWALLCRGSTILTTGHGSTMLQTTADFNLWKEHIPSRGFDSSFKEYHDKLHVAANNCCRFEFPIGAGTIPKGMRCPECRGLMDKYTGFLCFHGQTSLVEPF